MMAFGIEPVIEWQDNLCTLSRIEISIYHLPSYENYIGNDRSNNMHVKKALRTFCIRLLARETSRLA